MPLAAGTRLGPYEILGPLGAGGMGEVYKARDARLDRLVAIKVLPSDKLADAERKRRFVQEAKSASALNHPNIVTVHDVGSENGIEFLAMELVTGRTLEELTPRNGFRIPELLRYAVQIANALARAHAAGIVHRDLKPGNVMVTTDGLVKVLDFGLAKLAQSPTQDSDGGETATVATDAGMIVGTASFMSPEQAEGKPVDARSDIFSFGAMLYEMTTGQRAFRGDSAMSTISAVLRDEPASVVSVRQDVPGELERVIKRCLRKDPARRFQTMADLKVALEELKEESDSGSLSSARPAVPAPRARVSPWWIVAGVGGVAAAAIAVWAGTRTPTLAPVESMARPTPLTSYLGDESSASFSPDGNQMAFTWNGDKQDNYDIYVKVVGPGSPLRLTTDPAVDFSPQWSPDGRTIAFVRRNIAVGAAGVPVAVSGDGLGMPTGVSNTVILIPALGGPERVLARFVPGSAAARLAWSADGKWLVAAGRTLPNASGRTQSNGLHLISVESGEMRPLTAPPGEVDGDYEPAFAPNGRAIAFTRLMSMQVAELRVLNLSADLQPQGERRLTNGAEYDHGVTWTADSKEVVYSAGLDLRSNIYRVPVDGSRPPQLMESLGDGATSPVLSPNGQRLIFERFNRSSSIQRLDLQASTPAASAFIVSTSRDAFPQYSPDGKRVVFYSNRSGANQVWICDADGSRAAQLTSMPGTITGTPRWSPDGQRISFDSNSGGRWRVYVVDAGGGKPAPVTTDATDHFISTWSHDGQWIYVTSGGVENVWKVPSQGGNAIQITRNGGNAGLESADGSTLYFARTRGSASTLWAMPVAGGQERQLVPEVFRYNFAVTATGIYYDTLTLPDRPSSVEYLDLASGKVTTLFKLTRPVDLGLTVSPDRRHLLFAQSETYGSDLMLVENFK